MSQLLYHQFDFEEYYYVVSVLDSIVFISCEEELIIPEVNGLSEWDEWLKSCEPKLHFRYYTSSIQEINELYFVSFESICHFQNAIENDKLNTILDILIYLSYEKVTEGEPSAIQELRKLFQQLFGSLYHDEILSNLDNELNELQGKIHFNYDDENRYLIQSVGEVSDKCLKITAFRNEFFTTMFQSSMKLTNRFLHLTLDDDEFGMVVSRYLSSSDYHMPKNVLTKLNALERQYKIDLLLGTDTLYKNDPDMDEVQRLRSEIKNKS